ncbi:CNNM domain-containing protein, partial [Staphylococcus aureus]|nr:CNNM domain-containing protein [Staphylococcus aureus]
SLTTTISFAVSFIIVSYLLVVLCELETKSIAIQHTEKLALLYARPLLYFGNIMKTLIWLMDGSARVIIRIVGVNPDA